MDATELQVSLTLLHRYTGLIDGKLGPPRVARDEQFVLSPALLEPTANRFVGDPAISTRVQ